MKRSASAFAVLLLTVAMGLVSVSAALPSGYTEVGWVQATGSQWVLSGYTPACTDRIEMKVRFLPAQYKNWTLFCARGTSATTATFTCYWLNYYLYFNRNTDASTVSTISLGSSFYDRVVVADGNTLTCSIDGVECQTMAGGSFDVGSELLFFASHTAGTNLNASTTVSNKGEFKFYYARIYNSSGTLVREYVPVRDDSAADGAVAQYGLYETTTSTFHPNIGTTAFYAPTIVRVTPDAAGGGNGKSWTVDGGGNGPMTLAEAYNAATNDTGDGVSILLKTGHYDLTEELAFSRGITMRGGLAGTDDTTYSAANSVSILDGRHQIDTLVSINHTTSSWTETFERIEFTRARMRALAKGSVASYGRGRLAVSSCRFTGNGLEWDASYTSGGRAIYFSGTRADWGANIVVSNCFFGGNVCTNAASSYAGKAAVYLVGLRHADFYDSTFVTNGVAWWYPIGSKSVPNAAGGSALRVENSPVSLTRCKFIANRVPTSSDNNNYSSSTVELNNSQTYVPWTCGITNCLFIGNESVAANGNTTSYSGALLVYDSVRNTTAGIVNCTFAYNVFNTTLGSAGLTVKDGNVKVRNSIFYGNRLRPGNYKGCDFKLSGSTATADIDYSLFGSTAVSNVSNSADEEFALGGHVYAGAPKFVTSAADYFGLLTVTNVSSVATLAYLPDAETIARVLAMDAHVNADDSPAIDTGDDSPYANEPNPNGYRVNLGCYGNTSEAHITVVSQPTIVGNSLALTFPYATSQPHLAFALGGDVGAGYRATVVISWTTNGTDWTVYKTLYNQNNGTTFDKDLILAFLKGAALTFKVVVSAYGATDVTVTASTAVAYDMPASYGKDGGAGICHIRYNATGDGSGSDWFNAKTSFPATKDDYTSAITEFWVADDLPVGKSLGSSAIAGPRRVRGGFTGVECSPAERAKNAFTRVDGTNALATGFSLTISGTVKLDGFEFTRWGSRGASLYRTGADRYEVSNCRFTGNGLVRADYWLNGGGRGLHIDGGATTYNSSAVVSNCYFGGNACNTVDANKVSGIGALYLSSLRRGDVFDCTFETNGVTWFYPIGVASILNAAGGGAIRAGGTAVSLTRCKFIANRVPSGLQNENYCSAVVDIYCSDTSFKTWSCALTNCLFLGNESVCAANNSINSKMTGALMIFNATGATADVVNCTFAYNSFATSVGSAGFSLYKGAARVRNSIFYGNRTLPGSYTGADLKLSGSSGWMNVDYSMFGSLDASCVAANAGCTLIVGDHVKVGDPKFVTSAADYAACLTLTNATTVSYYAYLPDAATYEKVMSLNGHLRGNNGYVDENTGVLTYAGGKSPAIDAGDPAAGYKNEPVPNGYRVNLGFYGNTPWATMSGGGSLLLLK